MSARGFTVEFDGPNNVVYGPFPTSNGVSSNQIFGPLTSGSSSQTGLGLLTQPIPGSETSGIDFGGGLFRPGFDSLATPGNNPYVPGPQLPKLEFALFTFSAPVDVAQVLVDGVSNFGRTIWVAGGTAPPDFSAGLVPALFGFSVRNSLGSPGDGPSTHSFSDLTSISYLLVGAPPRPLVGNLGPINSTNGSQFYITDLIFASAVPEPATVILFAAGLGILAGIRKARSSNTSRAG